MQRNNIGLLYASLAVGAALAIGQSSPLLAQDYSDMSLDERLARLERINDSRNDLQINQSLDALQQEVQSLRGQLELYQRQLDIISKQQQDYYRDLDDRIRKLQPGGGVSAASSDSNGTNTATAITTTASGNSEELSANSPTNTASSELAASLAAVGSSMNNNSSLTATDNTMQSAAGVPINAPTADNVDAYLAAYQLVVNRRFNEAQLSLQQYIDQYPNGVYVPNAYYWLGEVHLTQKQLPQAESAFKTVVDRYPNLQMPY